MERKGVRIVKVDWLEDSLMNRSRRILNTLPYEYHPNRQTTMRGLVKRKREKCIQDSGAHGARVSVIVFNLTYFIRNSVRRRLCQFCPVHGPAYVPTVTHEFATYS